MEIFAVWAVSETRWKRGTSEASVGLACGKSVPTATAYSVPLTEITALPGAGLVPDATGVAAVDDPVDDPEPDELPDDEDDDPSFSSLSCCAKGSLLAKRLKDAN